MINPTIAAPVLLSPDDGAAPDASDAVLKLQRRTADALAGYTTMVDKAEPEFRPVAERFRALHERHNAALSAIVLRLGQEPDTDGSFMGTVNKAVVSLRALFDEIDEDVMVSIRDGEKHVLDGFDAAIDDVGLVPADRQELRDMRDELTLLLQDTSHLD